MLTNYDDIETLSILQQSLIKDANHFEYSSFSPASDVYTDLVLLLEVSKILKSPTMIRLLCDIALMAKFSVNDFLFLVKQLNSKAESYGHNDSKGVGI